MSETKDFHCSNCGAVLCQRRGNTLIEGNLEIELKRGLDVRCVDCKHSTHFYVDRQSEIGLLSQQ
jgi:ribosomal protein S27E